MKRTYQPSKVKRNRKFGFRARMKPGAVVWCLNGAGLRDGLNFPRRMKRNPIKRDGGRIFSFSTARTFKGKRRDSRGVCSGPEGFLPRSKTFYIKTDYRAIG